jgi:hypothetical protein
MYLRTCKSFKYANHKKHWLRKSQVRKVSLLRKVRKITSYLGPQICGFAICVTYLRTVHLWRGVRNYNFNELLSLSPVSLSCVN